MAINDQERTSHVDDVSTPAKDRSHRRIDVKEFALAVGRSPSEIPPDVVDLINATPLLYQRPDESLRHATMDRVRDVLRKDALPKSNASRKDDWERGWGENLQAYSGGDEIESALRPRYFHPTNVIRWRGDYAGVPDPDFEIRLVAAFRRWIYHAYLRDASRVFEFGCGTGRNLVDLAKVFPEKELVGLDWAQSAVNLVNAVGKAQGLHLRGRLFDFFDPDDTIVMGKGTAIFTLAALEQVGAQHRKFIDFLIGHEPDICVHLEPLVELYEPDHSFDQMAIKYHHMRGYLEGFLPAIRRLESQGQAEILEVRRFQFGSLFHEAYSLLVWRPR